MKFPFDNFYLCLFYSVNKLNTSSFIKASQSYCMYCTVYTAKCSLLSVFFSSLFTRAPGQNTAPNYNSEAHWQLIGLHFSLQILMSLMQKWPICTHVELHIFTLFCQSRTQILYRYESGKLRQTSSSSFSLMNLKIHSNYTAFRKFWLKGYTRYLGNILHGKVCFYSNRLQGTIEICSWC